MYAMRREKTIPTRTLIYDIGLHLMRLMTPQLRERSSHDKLLGGTMLY